MEYVRQRCPGDHGIPDGAKKCWARRGSSKGRSTKMTRIWIASILLTLNVACAKPPAAPEEKPKAFGAALVSVSGEKQAAGVGASLDQPLVVQVNDPKGTPVSGALVRFTGAGGTTFQTDHGLTGPDGQFTTSVTLGGMSGHYQIAATALNSVGKPVQIRI